MRDRLRSFLALTAGAVTGSALMLCIGFVAFTRDIQNHLNTASISALTLTSQAPNPDPRPAPLDGIVVVTGGERRLDAAVRLFSEGKARRLLISGVNKSTRREDLMRRLSLDPVLFDCCVDIGYAALDTVGNADEARDWASVWQFQRIAVVTSNYHMPRTLVEFQRAMPESKFMPHAVVSAKFAAPRWWLEPSALKLAVSEYMKFLPATARRSMAHLAHATRPHQESQQTLMHSFAPNIVAPPTLPQAPKFEPGTRTE